MTTKFKKGDKVRISAKGRLDYPNDSSNPHEEVGTVFDFLGNWTKVQWEASTNIYLQDEIEPASKFNKGDRVRLTKGVGLGGLVEGAITTIKGNPDCNGNYMVWALDDPSDWWCVAEDRLELAEDDPVKVYSVGDILKKMSVTEMLEAGIPEGTKLLCVGSTCDKLYVPGEEMTIQSRSLVPCYTSGYFGAWKIISFPSPEVEVKGLADGVSLIGNAPDGFYKVVSKSAFIYRLGDVFELRSGILYQDGVNSTFNGCGATFVSVPSPETKEESYVWTYFGGETEVHDRLPNDSEKDVASVNKLGARFERIETTTITWKEV